MGMAKIRSIGALLGFWLHLISLLGVESWLPPCSLTTSPTQSTRRAAELSAGDTDAEIVQRTEKAARMERLARASRAAAEAYEAGKRRNVFIAMGSAAVGAAAFALQRSGGSDPVALLHRMEAESVTSTPSPPPRLIYLALFLARALYHDRCVRSSLVYRDRLSSLQRSHWLKRCGTGGPP